MFMKRSGFNSLKDALTKLENAFCNSRSFVRRVITIVSLHVTCQLCSWDFVTVLSSPVWKQLGLPPHNQKAHWTGVDRKTLAKKHPRFIRGFVWVAWWCIFAQPSSIPIINWWLWERMNRNPTAHSYFSIGRLPNGELLRRRVVFPL